MSLMDTLGKAIKDAIKDIGKEFKSLGGEFKGLGSDLKNIPGEVLNVGHHVKDLSGEFVEIGGEACKETGKVCSEIKKDTVVIFRESGNGNMERYDTASSVHRENHKRELCDFNYLLNIDDRELKQVMICIDTMDLMLAIKGSEPQIVKRIYEGLSDEKTIEIKENIDSLAESPDKEQIKAAENNIRNILTNTIESRKVSFNDLKYINSEGLRDIINFSSTMDFIVALKGAEPQIVKRIYEHLNPEAAQALKEDLDTLSENPVDEEIIKDSQNEIVNIIKFLVISGKARINYLDKCL